MQSTKMYIPADEIMELYAQKEHSVFLWKERSEIRQIDKLARFRCSGLITFMLGFAQISQNGFCKH